MEGAQVVSSRATASLVSDVDSVAPGRAFRVGLRLRLSPTGWHTYWQNPGEAGIPPELNFRVAHRCDGRTDCLAHAAAGARRVADELFLHWQRAAAGDADRPPAAGAISIKAHANWLVCRDICVPEEGEFRLDLGETARPRRRHRCSPRSTARCRGLLPGTRWSAGMGRCS